MRATLSELATRLFPSRRVARNLQHLEELVVQLLNDNRQALTSGLDQQRDQFEAHATLLEQSFEQLKQKLSREHETLNELSQKVTEVFATQHPRRLFISTGYFATTVAAAIAQQQNRVFDDYLLVTLDRQSGTENRKWAYQLKEDWVGVQTISHEDYYERTQASPELPFSDIEFAEIYSPFVEMGEFVRHNFPAQRYEYYEEGLTSYLQALRFAPHDTNSRFFALAPTVLRNADIDTVPVDCAVFTQLLRRSAQCYRIPRLAGKRNIIIVTSGAAPHDGMSPAAYLDPYTELVATLIGKGYTVWVKDHPRVPLKETFPTSKVAQMGGRLLETDAPLLETVISHNAPAIAAIVSVYSSILVHAYSLFGIPAFSLHAQPTGETQRWWKGVQDAIVPDVVDLENSCPNDLDRVTRDFHNQNLQWVPPV
ncbi:polysialyltransferase family glycosyltransferase [Paraburkholderia ferrariae]|uniref:polysialyltransferase family glycosyltransferase n=1 Tax=Paraburkholderia ferrariae TaxID=386056 RepID=UPI0004886447|nr:polysialyltransferase family glycosyltransferase [Paraburkholderia ferrariae]